MSGAVLVAAAALVAAAGTSPPRADATVPARELLVPAPGRVRVALDGQALAMVPPGGGLTVLDPGGRAIPSQLLTAPRGTVPIALAETEETADGWSVVFDTGVVPLEYERLVVTPTRETAAAVRVWGSGDGAAWSPLGRGSFVRLGDEAGLVRTALDLPPPSFRFLRLDWPRAAGFPALERAAVVVRDGARPGAPTLRAPVSTTAVAGSWRVELPGAGLRATHLLLRGTGLEGATLRLLAAQEGRWAPLADVAACGAPCAIALPDARIPSSTLRIENETGRGPSIDGAELELEPTWLLFDADTAGRFLAAPRLDEDRGTRSETASGRAVVDVALGAPAEAPLAPLDADATDLAPAGHLPRGWLSWPIDVPPGVRPGDVVRIEIGDALLAQPGVRADGLRPMVGAMVVPFVLDVAAEPEAGAGAGAVDGRVSLPVGTADGASVQVELRAAPGVRCEGEVDASWVRQPRPGVLDRGPAGRGSWSRGVSGAGPCLAFVDVALPEFATAVELAARPGASPPATARAWRARHAVRFAWPDLSRAPQGARVVRLASGFDPLLEDAPRVRNVRRQLGLRPATAATVDIARTGAEIERTARLTRWALWGALLVAAFVLFVVLGRGLSRRSAGT
jgi:hypothetical protein